MWVERRVVRGWHLLDGRRLSGRVNCLFPPPPSQSACVLGAACDLCSAAGRMQRCAALIARWQGNPFISSFSVLKHVHILKN